MHYIFLFFGRELFWIYFDDHRFLWTFIACPRWVIHRRSKNNRFHVMSIVCNSNLACIKFFRCLAIGLIIGSDELRWIFTTMKGSRRFLFILLIAGVLFVEVASSKCSKDTDCTRPGDVCCKRDFTCRTKRICDNSWCIIHSHCPDGKCVDSLCIPNSRGTESCYSDKDCYNNTTTTENLKCCGGKCKDRFWCSVTIFTTTKSTSTVLSSSCVSWKDCANGEQCEGGKCEKSSNVMLTKAGFLSAAILTGSVFLLILCCCFVRESRYSRQRYAERQRRRSRNRRRSRQSRRRSTHHSTTAVENRAFSREDRHEGEGGFFIPPPEYPRDLTTPDVIHSSPPGEQPPSPPPYCTLSFELPPSYEEALQTEENRDQALTEVA